MDTLLNLSNVKNAHKIAKNAHTWDFNCWGATLYALNQIDDLEWIEADEMEEFLECHTIKVDDSAIQKGDILVLRDGEQLEHTAIYMGQGKFWHKRGANRSEYADRARIEDIYWDCPNIEVRRLIKGGIE